MLTCRKTTLSNGLRLVAVEMPHLHSAEIAVYLKVGGRNDPPDKAGLAHFLEHMLFRGTEEHPTNLELETAFEAIGGSVNAATDEETTCYFSRIHPAHVSEGLRLFSAMLLRPTLPGIDIEKKIITEEALEDINEQGKEINTHNLASRLLWPGHPLGAPTIGYLDTIESFTVEDLRRHLLEHYVPANAVVVVAGRVNAEEVFEAGAAAFGPWQGASPPAMLLTSSGQDAPQTVFVTDPDSQVHVQLAFRGFARPDRSIMALRLLRRILCGGGSSRLHLSLRERLGMVYSVDASIAAYEETGAFAIELSTAPENFGRTVEEVLAETLLLATEPVSAPELERVKQGYFYDLEYSRDATYEMQVRYGWGELMGLVRDVEEDRAEAEAVNEEELLRVARQLFRPGNLNLVAVGAWKHEGRKKVNGLIGEYVDRYQRLTA
ncbi:MAG TPA: pitrilysin family protein [Geobacteraceae bacterium]